HDGKDQSGNPPLFHLRFDEVVDLVAPGEKGRQQSHQNSQCERSAHLFAAKGVINPLSGQRGIVTLNGMNSELPGFSRRAFVGVAAFASVSLAVPSFHVIAALPGGPSPEPVPLPYFPNRLHAFIWRNWPLVPAETLATGVDATPAP